MNLQLLTFQRHHSPPLPLRAQLRLGRGGGGLCVYIVCLGKGGRGRVHVLGKRGDRLSFCEGSRLPQP